jgi:hypothetical protein
VTEIGTELVTELGTEIGSDSDVSRQLNHDRPVTSTSFVKFATFVSILQNHAAVARNSSKRHFSIRSRGSVHRDAVESATVQSKRRVRSTDVGKG